MSLSKRKRVVWHQVRLYTSATTNTVYPKLILIEEDNKDNECLLKEEADD